MQIYQLSTHYSRTLPARVLINVADQSEVVEAEIAIGKDLSTGEWCASMDFNDIPWANGDEMSLCCDAPINDFGYCEFCKEHTA